MNIAWSEVLNIESVVKWLLTSGLKSVLIVLGAYVVIRIGTFISKRVEGVFEDDDPTIMSEREKQAATLGKVIRNGLRAVVWGVALLMILLELGIEIGPILASVGVIGLAVGFGAQSLVKDFLAGMFVLIENQYNVGDVVQVAGVAGQVSKITLRTTVLRDIEGKVHVIPNGQIAVVSNLTRQWSRAVLDIGVAYKEDVDKVIAIMRDVGNELAADPKFAPLINQPPEIPGVQEFGDSAVMIRIMFTTKPIKQWDVAREFRRRLKKAFDANGIEIPFPHRTVYLGEGSPMRGKLAVKLEEESKDV